MGPGKPAAMVSVRCNHRRGDPRPLGGSGSLFYPVPRYRDTTDYFTRWKLQPALEAIRTPPLALARPLFPDPAIARVTRSRRPRSYASVPAERFIWDADRLSGEATARSAVSILQELSRMQPRLTDRQ